MMNSKTGSELLKNKKDYVKIVSTDETIRAPERLITPRDIINKLSEQDDEYEKELITSVNKHLERESRIKMFGLISIVVLVSLVALYFIYK